MARTDIKYDTINNKTHVIVSHKRTTKIVASFDNIDHSLEVATFLTKVFHEITMDTMKECHKKAVEAIKGWQDESDSLSK